MSGVFQGRWGVGRVELIPQFALSSISQAKLHNFNRMSNSAFNRLPRQKHLRKCLFFFRTAPSQRLLSSTVELETYVRFFIFSIPLIKCWISKTVMYPMGFWYCRSNISTEILTQKKKEKEKAKVTKVYLNLKWWGSSWKVNSAINNSQFKTITSRIVSSKAQGKDN